MSTYELSPPPTIIELDLRSDGPIIQSVLRRLTGRGTVPNVILQVRIQDYIPITSVSLIVTSLGARVLLSVALTQYKS